MKPHPRIRKTIKWGGAVVTVLLVLVWVGTLWQHVGWNARRWGAVFNSGSLVFRFENPLPQATSAKSGPVFRSGWERPFHWWFAIDERYQVFNTWTLEGWTCRYLRIPVWTIAALSLGVTAIGWRLDTLARRRARLNLCPKCRYDRTGLAAGAVCPECGAASPSV